MTRDGWLLFATRGSRMFAYGLLSVVLMLYLVEAGFKEWEVGLLLSLTLAGDTVISLWLTTTADRFGRRRTLIVGSILMVLAGITFISTSSFLLLVIAATIGVISPSGNEIGPFLSVEQAALSHIVSDDQRTDVFAWYNLVGSFSTALGALAGGSIAEASQHFGLTGAAAFRPVLLAYAGIGVAMIGGFALLSSAIEATRDESCPPPKPMLGLHESTEDGFQAVDIIRPGCSWRWLRHPEHHRILVPHSIPTRPGDDRHDFPVRQPLGRCLGFGRWLVCSTHWADQYNDLHASAVERAADPGPADARRVIGLSACCYCGSAFRRWMCRLAKPTRWPSCVPMNDPQRLGSRQLLGRWVLPSRQCWRPSSSAVLHG